MGLLLGAELKLNIELGADAPQLMGVKLQTVIADQSVRNPVRWPFIANIRVMLFNVGFGL